MRIVCPSCEAVYQVPDATLAKARVMRCARCAQLFEPPVPAAVEAPDEEPAAEHVAPSEPDDAVEPEPEPEPEMVPVAAPAPLVPSGHDADPEEWPPVSRARKIQVLSAWGASLVVLILLIGLGVAYRQPVMRAWPASARLYTAIGLRS